jgi:hypothetical protein
MSGRGQKLSENLELDRSLAAKPYEIFIDKINALLQTFFDKNQ